MNIGKGDNVKITITTDVEVADTQISIVCKNLTPEIEKVIAMLRMMDLQLTGEKDGETHIIDATKVLYIDSVDKKVFLYTKDDVYETNLHLYELEEQLARFDFFRANKSCIINFKQIVSLKADMNRRLRATMSNGEQLIISRQYAEVVKERLGVK